MKTNRIAHTLPLMKKLKLLNVDHVNEYSALVFIFKSLNNLTYSPVSFNYRNVEEHFLRNNNNHNLEVPFTRNRFSQMFITIRGAKLWNTIPLNIRNATYVESFKQNLKKYSFVNYVL